MLNFVKFSYEIIFIIPNYYLDSRRKKALIRKIFFSKSTETDGKI